MAEHDGQEYSVLQTKTLDCPRLFTEIDKLVQQFLYRVQTPGG